MLLILTRCTIQIAHRRHAARATRLQGLHRVLQFGRAAGVASATSISPAGNLKALGMESVSTRPASDAAVGVYGENLLARRASHAAAASTTDLQHCNGLHTSAVSPGPAQQSTSNKRQKLAQQPKPLRQRTLNGKTVAVRGSRPSAGQQGVTQLGQGAVVAYHPASWSPAESNSMLERLQEEVAWLHKEVRVMGRTVLQPRLIAYMADDTSGTYTYSGLTLNPSPWAPVVQEIRAKVEAMAGTRFDSCLLNLYRDGKDCMGWHSDNEKIYGDNPTIGSASFGAARDFILRHNEQRDRKLSFPLGDGDILIMSGSTQSHWMHAVPKRLGVSLPRVNLTFRKVVQLERSGKRSV